MSGLANFVVQPPLHPPETFIVLLHRFLSALNEQQVRIPAHPAGVDTTWEDPGDGMSWPCCLPTLFLSTELAPCPNVMARCIWTPVGAVPWWGPCYASLLVPLLGALVSKGCSLHEVLVILWSDGEDVQ